MSTMMRKMASSAIKSTPLFNGSLSSTRALSSSAIIKTPSIARLTESTPLPQNYLRPLGARMFSSDQGFAFAKSHGRRTAINFGVQIVPQQEAYVIERFGKFQEILDSGLHFLIPGVDKIAYIHSLKEQAIRIPNQAAVTTDNVSLHIDGVLFVKVVNAEKASYGVDDPIFAVTQLAQTSMRSAIGKMTLDKTFMERSTLNTMIVEAINDAVSDWGLKCLRYEIRDITPPPGVKQAMEMQAEAERRKRAEILEAEGKRQADIARAEGKRQAVILESEAAELDEVNRARGKRTADILRAQGTADSLKLVAESLEKYEGEKAANLKIAEQYIEAFNKLAKESTTVLLPSSLSEPVSMMSAAMGLYKKMNEAQLGKVFSDNPAAITRK